MRRQRASIEDEGGVDITPMIDVVFIMLIFFIVTASFIKESGVEIKRPPAVTATPKVRASILVGIDESGQVWVDKRPIDVRAVRSTIERLRAENPEGSIVVQADTNSKSEVLVKVMDAIKQAGVDECSISARPVD
ncbi:MAG: biopolymer transporter ExbD [Myxococcales bacterium]|nr:biopolymer transporter ExbD [Myxococcales bacterium]